MRHRTQSKIASVLGASVALALWVALAGCATTEITSSWKAPSAPPIERGQKVVAVVVAPDSKQRRAAEDELASELADGTPAHEMFSEAELKDPVAVRKRLEDEGFKYGVVMSVVDVKTETQTTAQPGVATYDVHNMWAGDEGLVWQDVEELRTEVRVVTRVYTVDDGKVVWQAESRTMDPTEVKGKVDEIAKAAAARLKKDAMVAAK
jgi:hypothetical protein